MKEDINNHQVEPIEHIYGSSSKAKPQDRPVCTAGLNSVEAARIRRQMRRISRDGK